MVKALNPDIIVNATGSVPTLPPITGLHDLVDKDGSNVATVLKMIERINEYPEDMKGQKIAIIGGGAVGLDVMEFFTERGAEVTMVEMLPMIGNGLDPVTKCDTNAKMAKYGVKQMTNTALQEGFSEEAARQAAQGGFGGFGGFGGNGSFSGSYSSNGGPFTHQEFHFENGSGDMDDIFSMFGDMFSHGGGNHSGWSTSGNSGFTGNSGSWSNFSGGRSSAGRKGSDVMADLTISFDEAVFGCEKSISLQDPSTGKVSNLSIHIPAGIESGKTVRLKGQGNPGRNGGAAGDVLLNVNVTPSSEFERKGQNVYSTIRVPFTTAALGGKARVHTLYGDVECSIKAGTQGGSRIRLKGKGISSMKNPSVKGDQYVTVEISVPRKLTPRAKEALEEYRAVS